MTPYRQPIMGVGDIAEYFGVSKQLAGKWARDWEDWPKPFAIVRAGTFWATADVIEVCKRHRRKKGAGPFEPGYYRDSKRVSKA